MQMPEKALEIDHQLVTLLKENYPPNHPEISIALGYYGRTLCVLERFDEAEKILKEAEAINAITFTRVSANGYQVHRYLSEVAYNKDDLDGAIYHAELSAELSKKTYPVGHYYRKLGAQVYEDAICKQLFESLSSSRPDIERAQILVQKSDAFYAKQNKTRDSPYLIGLVAYLDYLKGDKKAKLKLRKVLVKYKKLRQTTRAIKATTNLELLLSHTN